MSAGKSKNGSAGQQAHPGQLTQVMGNERAQVRLGWSHHGKLHSGPSVGLGLGLGLGGGGQQLPSLRSAFSAPPYS